jgi:hypothetical protein
METQVSSNVGTKVIIPSITKSVKNFNDSMTDYDYKVTIRGNKGSSEQIRFTRHALTAIRTTLKNIILNGFSENIYGKTFNKDYKFVAINLRNPGFGNMKLKDADVYIENNNTKERFHFNMSNVFKVKGLAFSSTGTRTNQYHKKNVVKNAPTVVKTEVKNTQNDIKKSHINKNTKRVKLTPEQMIEKRREYYRKRYLKNRERILEQKKEYNAKNRERRTAYNREWRKKNREHVNAYSRALYHKNPKRREYCARYYAKKKAEKLS